MIQQIKFGPWITIMPRRSVDVLVDGMDESMREFVLGDFSNANDFRKESDAVHSAWSKLKARVSHPAPL